MTDIEINVVNAHALDPSKVYIFEYDPSTLDGGAIRAACDYLWKHNINGIFVRAENGMAFHITEMTPTARPEPSSQP